MTGKKPETLDWRQLPGARAIGDSVIFLNPKLSQKDQQAFLKLAEKFSLKDHVWIASSGSSSRSGESGKLMALGQEALWVSARAVNKHLRSGKEDVWLQALPEFHVGGLSIRARAFLSGAAVVKLEDWEPSLFAETCTRSFVTLASLVPTQVFDLVQKKLQAPPSLRAIVIGGSALSDDLYHQALELGWPLLPSYGMTECCSQIATADLGKLWVRDRSLKILDHVEARVVDERLQVRSQALLTGFAEWIDGEARFKDPKSDGWYQSEDRCEIENGFLFPKGRSSEYVKILGEGVNLQKLQEILESRAQKLFAEQWQSLAVAARPEPRSGFEILLVSSAGLPRPQLKQLIEDFNSQVAPYEKIRDHKEVPAVPRTPLGKLAREKLNDLIQAISS